jgi:hypothetical protein
LLSNDLEYCLWPLKQKIRGKATNLYAFSIA